MPLRDEEYGLDEDEDEGESEDTENEGRTGWYAGGGDGRERGEENRVMKR